VWSAKKSSRQIDEQKPAVRNVVTNGGTEGLGESTHPRIVSSARRNFTAVLDPSLAVLSAVINRNWRGHDSVYTKKTDHRNLAKPAERFSSPRHYPIGSVVENAGNRTLENLPRLWPVCTVGRNTRRSTVTRNTALPIVLMMQEGREHSGTIGRCEENRKRRW